MPPVALDPWHAEQGIATDLVGRVLLEGRGRQHAQLVEQFGREPCGRFYTDDSATPSVDDIEHMPLLRVEVGDAPA